ncbi:MAG: GNAT family N-acetyltransferase [Myxococcales bacterium]|nr:GNAT family N-acetyltransferase [Myxococcales bacterium]
MLAVPTRAELRSRPLTTARLMLAPIETKDAHDLWYAVEGSRTELERWLPWVPFTVDPEASFRYADASAQDWDAGRACRLAVRDRETQRFLGVVSLESMAHIHQNMDLGYWLRTDAVGAGYMTEAATETLRFCFRQLCAHRVRVAAATDNHPSQAVIRRLGFTFEGVARQAERVSGRWLDHAIFGMLVTDPRAVSIASGGAR